MSTPTPSPSVWALSSSATSSVHSATSKNSFSPSTSPKESILEILSYSFRPSSPSLLSLVRMSITQGVGIYRFLIKSYGYIQTFKLTDYLTIIAAFVGVLNLSVGTQAFSRVVFGLVAGINTILVPTYLTSVLPGAMGGPAGTLNQLFITIGIFFGFWMGYLVIGETAGDMGWRLLVGLPILPALIRLHTTQNVYPYIHDYLAFNLSKA